MLARNGMKELSGKIIELVSPENSAENYTIIRSLESLRELASLTIEQMAVRLNLQPETICKVEFDDGIQIAYLQKYVHALGGEIHLVEEQIDTSDVRSLYCIRATIADDMAPGHQLVLPMFEGKFIPGSRGIVLSIHPKYCSKILAGKKTIELRRRFPVSGIRGSIAYIYSTSPVQAMVGRMEIVDVIKMPICKIWQVYGRDACIEKKELDSYFTGLAVGTVLKIRNPAPLSRKIELPELRRRFGFEPPQSFVYAKADFIGALDGE